MAEANASFTSLVSSLKEGESVSRAIRIPFEDFEAKSASKKLSSIRNSMNQIATRVRELTARHFRIETGQFVTYDGSAVVLTAVLTCMDDEGEDDI